jgi:hypothetical protein
MGLPEVLTNASFRLLSVSDDVVRRGWRGFEHCVGRFSVAHCLFLTPATKEVKTDVCGPVIYECTSIDGGPVRVWESQADH